MRPKFTHILILLLLSFNNTFSQICPDVIITCTPYESRCSATGSIDIDVAGGSGNFSYKAIGPVTTLFTSLSTITGLPPGTYTVIVRDEINNCTSQLNNVIVPGNYADPRFLLNSTDVTCINGNDGTISVTDQQFGRAPFTYTIIAPSASNIGASNSTGSFSGLTAGDYFIQLKDSCGGIQTRLISILNYDWWIDAYTVNKLVCSDISVLVQLKDNKGNTNLSGTVFNGFTYGITNNPGDTTWYTAYNFTHTLTGKRSIDIVVKDKCGNIKKVSWKDTAIPSVADAVAITNASCNTFTASITGKKNLTNPEFCLYGADSVLVACNSTGVFDNLAFGSYCIRIKNSCYDTAFERCFTAVPVKPSAGAIISSDISCATFTATVTGTQNLSNPQYCLYDNNAALISCNITGVFGNLSFGSYCINIKDGCYDTTIVRCITVNKPLPSGVALHTSNLLCPNFTLTVDSLQNFFNPDFCLYDNTGTLIGCNNTGVFDSLAYGSYCVHVKDNCYDTTIIKCIDVSRPLPSVGNVLTFNFACASFSASVGNLQNIFNPQFCLYDNNGVLIGCNNTGVFDSLMYGSYCMQIKDGCYDTTIIRCFTGDRPVPAVGGVITSNLNCTNFSASVDGLQNIFNAQYCLYDNNDNLITCNNTGVFDSLAYGSYCIHVKDSCYDTTIIKCFSATRPLPSAGSVRTFNKKCAFFSAEADNLQNITNPQFCLYNNNGDLISCNTTGVFDSLAYGSYCMHIKDGCYDTTIVKCFSANQPIPSISIDISTSNKTCSTFTVSANADGSNITNPQYCLYNNLDTLISCNTSGDFTNLPYGSYCIKVKDGCYDTTVTKCFTVNPVPVSISVTADPSCTINKTDIRVKFNSGGNPKYRVFVYNEAGSLLAKDSSNSSAININNLPLLDSGEKYKVVGINACGYSDTVLVTPDNSYFSKSISVKAKCPGATYPDGSSDVSITVKSNYNNLEPLITKKNGATVNIRFTTYLKNASGSHYDFLDMEPAVYIFTYKDNSCGNIAYDTVTVLPYAYPALDKSAAYQCDNNGFSVGTTVKGGVQPFMYEIIQSTPAFPSIVTAPQSNPVFSINNGTVYSLVRLRVTDACGNASLNDASVLPLSNIKITTTLDCTDQPATLSVDEIPNAEYAWYKRVSATDSVLISTTPRYRIDSLKPSDTGKYVCKVSVNNQCLTRIAYFQLNGYCGLLPEANEIRLSGRIVNNQAALIWETGNDEKVKKYVIEKSSNTASGFEIIGEIKAKKSAASLQYFFTDNRPSNGKNYYRIKIIKDDGGVVYSNLINLSVNVGKIVVYPNPATEMVTVVLPANTVDGYRLNVLTMQGTVIYSRTEKNNSGNIIQVKRLPLMPPGTYLVQVINNRTAEIYNGRIVFR